MAIAAVADEVLQEIEREAAALKREKLSRAGRLRVNRLVAAVDELHKQLAPLVTPFSPTQAGQGIVAEFKNAEGGAWSGAELQQKFDLSAAVLHRRRKEHRIVYWRDAQHDYFYPRWQFTETGALLPGIQEILQKFRSQDEWRVMRYFLSARKQLGDRRPLDLVRAGELDTVLNHAQAHAAENTW